MFWSQNCCLLCVWVGFLHSLPCHCQSKNTKIDMICRSLWNHCFRHLLTTVKTLSLNSARWKCMSVHMFTLEPDVRAEAENSMCCYRCCIKSTLFNFSTIQAVILGMALMVIAMQIERSCLDKLLFYDYQHTQLFCYYRISSSCFYYRDQWVGLFFALKEHCHVYSCHSKPL